MRRRERCSGLTDIASRSRVGGGLSRRRGSTPVPYISSSSRLRQHRRTLIKGSSAVRSADDESLIPLREVILSVPSRLHKASTSRRLTAMVELRVSWRRKGSNGMRRAREVSTLQTSDQRMQRRSDRSNVWTHRPGAE